MREFCVVLLIAAFIAIGITAVIVRIDKTICLNNYSEFSPIYSGGCYVHMENQYIPASLYKMENPELFR